MCGILPTLTVHAKCRQIFHTWILYGFVFLSRELYMPPYRESERAIIDSKLLWEVFWFQERELIFFFKVWRNKLHEIPAFLNKCGFFWQNPSNLIRFSLWESARSQFFFQLLPVELSIFHFHLPGIQSALKLPCCWVAVMWVMCLLGFLLVFLISSPWKKSTTLREKKQDVQASCDLPKNLGCFQAIHETWLIYHQSSSKTFGSQYLKPHQPPTRESYDCGLLRLEL